MGKRKRDSECPKSRKRLHTSARRDESCAKAPELRHPLLQAAYLKLYSLEEYLLLHLPTTLRVTRRRVATFDVDHPEALGFLRTTIIGVRDEPAADVRQARKTDLVDFAQTQRSSSGHSGNICQCSVDEVISFVIWQLFQKDLINSRRPDHLLCYGYQRGPAATVADCQPHQDLCMPGITQKSRNANAEALRSSPWTRIMDLLGTDGDHIMTNLLLDCGVFRALDSGKDNFYQLSGKPVFKLAQEEQGVQLFKAGRPSVNATRKGGLNILRPTTKIVFVRNRMLYARPAINGHGGVQLGLRHIHILNRTIGLSDDARVVRLMQYAFPRQFGLHNVFTSKVSIEETTQPLQDYTVRESEIAELTKGRQCRIPRRLRGLIADLIRKLIRNHRACSYTQLLRFYCPVKEETGSVCSSQGRGGITQSQQPTTKIVTQLSAEPRSTMASAISAANSYADSSFLLYSIPTVNVSSFCQAVLRHILPQAMLGTGADGERNWSKVLSTVDRFIKMRRFESLSLHEASQGLKLSCIRWLCPHKIQHSHHMAASDTYKRLELLNELLYYVFDSFLIPLVRSNFYVTETGLHRNRLFYFRHDVWRRLSEPSLLVLKTSMFKSLNSRQLRHAFESSKLGYSQIRLLPKDAGARPITNLKRRIGKQVNGRRVLGPSINAQLAPVFSVLNFVRHDNPNALGSAMFSVGDIRGRLKAFKTSLSSSSQSRLYFVKVDIRSCFDTIPQGKLLDLINNLLNEPGYRTSKHVEAKRLINTSSTSRAQLITKFVGTAKPTAVENPFSEVVANEIAGARKRVVFVGTDHERIWRLTQIKTLLQDHIQHNIIRLGQKYFKQTGGIPQGSVLSSLLCSFFYGDFEHQRLGFLAPRSSLMLRLIDDFLLITTDEVQAHQFVEAMSRGHTDFGITINAEKSLVNFEVAIDGRKIPRFHGSNHFPYCGLSIDMTTLELSKDRQKKDVHIGNALTIDIYGNCGGMFQRRVLSALKIQMHAMLLDNTLNQRSTIMKTIFGCFVETSMKLHQYRSHMPRKKRPGVRLMIAVCEQLISLALKMARRECVQVRADINRRQMCWIASTAMTIVLSKKQSEYSGVLHWLARLRTSTEQYMGVGRKALDEIARDGWTHFQDYVY